MGKSIGKLISFQHQNQDSFLRGKKKKEMEGGSYMSKQNRTKQNLRHFSQSPDMDPI